MPPLSPRVLVLLALLIACSSAPSAGPHPVEPNGQSPDTAPQPEEGRPIIAARDAFERGWMPLDATGVKAFIKAHPRLDGRGVIIGILDSGLDPTIPGLLTTSTGERKVLELRDFSGEGAVPLNREQPEGDSIRIGGRMYGGVSRVRALTTGPMYVGALAELPLGEPPASDLNGNGSNTDSLAVLVARATDGWVLFADQDGDGSLAGERPVHDFLVARQTFGWSTGGRPAPTAVAVNLSERAGAPVLNLFFDTSAHGSHVAGIAAGHDIYGVSGFNGVAPGASLIGLKIADNAQGGISTTGSMMAAIDYAIRFAAQRRQPLVLNMSFGVGNEVEGRARIDGLIDSVLAVHPELVFTISAGNDGPGLSTVGFPGTATRALTVGATYPGVFLGGLGNRPDPVAYFSSRGGEVAKPDLVTPGLAYSTVPRWNVGDEQKGGTSMAAPHAAGLAALLVSGLVQQDRSIESRQVRQALMVTARPVVASSYLDDGVGLPDIDAAWRWIERDPRVPEILARALPGGNTAAWHVGPDSLRAFALTRPAGAPAERFRLRSSAGWLKSPATVPLVGAVDTVIVRYDPAAFRRPGVYTGTITGWSSDTVAGPLFRLVNTVVIPEPGDPVVARLGRVPAGGNGRVFFPSTADRPFSVATSTGAVGEQVLAYLHEPGGMPYREENGMAAGHGENASGYIVDGRDVVPGVWEAVAVAPPFQSADVTVIVRRSPVSVSAARVPDGISISLQNLTQDTVALQPFVVLVGAERVVKVVRSGSDPQRISFQVPDWAVHAVVDVSMDPAQWPRFTDFGVTVFDAAGQQLGKSPLNYAFGRLHVSLPDHRAEAASVGLFPGFAEPSGDERWTATVSIRLYADSAHVSRVDAPAVDLAPGARKTVLAPFTESPVSLGDAFFPLGIVVLPEEDYAWTREVGLSLPVPPPSR